MMQRLRTASVHAVILVLSALCVQTTLGAPTAVNDSFSGTEDTPLTPAGGGVLGSADFEAGGADGYTLLKNAFGTTANTANTYMNGALSTSSVHGGTGSYYVDCGHNAPEPYATSTAITQTFAIGSPGTIRISFWYRLRVLGGLEWGGSSQYEFGDMILDVDGTRYGTPYSEPLAGNATGTAIEHIRGPQGTNTGSGADYDSNWKSYTVDVPVTAGNRVIKIGVLCNRTTGGGEHVDAYLDDVVVEMLGGASSVLANDTGGAVSAQALTQPAKGTLQFNGNGSFTYTPNANTNGADTFTYRASDGTSWSNTATVTLNIAAVNDAPEAADNTYSVNEDATLTVNQAQGVLANDTDIDSASLTAAVVAAPTNGALTLNSNGSFTYTPAANFSGTDTFTYRASDGALNSNTATVTITVNPQNDPPTGAADSYFATRNTPLVITDVNGTVSTETIIASAVRGAGNAITTPGALWKYWDTGALGAAVGTTWRNLTFDETGWKEGASELGYGDTSDNFPEQTVISYGADASNKFPTAYFRKVVNVEKVANITAVSMQVMRDDGAIVYLNGNRIFRNGLSADPAYTDVAANGSNEELAFINAANMGSATNQNAEAVAPHPGQLVEGNNIFAAEVHQNTLTSSDLSFDIQYAITRTVNPGLLKNDTDPEGDTVTAVVNTQPANGTVTVNANGSFTYQPKLNFVGTDTFTYRATDGAAQSAPVTVTITVEPGANAPPLTVADSYNATEDTTLVVNAAAGVLANDTDPEGDTFSAAVATQPAKGALTLNADGSFTYVPNANANGADSFTYRASDGRDSLPATVTITIAAVNDPPVAVADSYGGDPGQNLTVPAATGVLANDSDVDGNTLTAQLVSAPASGTLTLNPNGSFTYVPSGTGIRTFTYRVSDGSGGTSSPVTVTITLNAAPVAQSDSYQTPEDTQLVVNAAAGVLANDSDAENATLTAQLASDPVNGSLTLQSDGSFQYTPFSNVSGSDSFTYRAFDGVRLSAPATVSLTIVPVNDPPVAANDSYTIAKGQTLAVAAAQGVLANDRDTDSPALTAQVVAAPQSGQLTLNSNGAFTYIPNTGFSGTDTFSYLASDGQLSSSIATVTISISSGGENVVISEIMYRPGSTFPEQVNLEFIELYNRGTIPADLAGWSIDSGVGFTFPPGAAIPAKGFLVVCANLSAFQTVYPGVTNVVGGWIGGLSNNSEKISLTDAAGQKYDSVAYASEGDWAQRIRETTFQGWDWSTAANGGGRSLELRNPNVSNDNGQNWASSTAVGGTPGAGNSASTANIPPIIKAVKHSPAVPSSTDTVLVSCELNDESPPAGLTATLYWRDATTTTPAAFTPTPMSWDGDEGWVAPIGPKANLTIIEFYVSASDGVNTRTWPAPTSEGQNANCQYLVTNEAASATAETYHLVLTAAENAAFTGVSTSSDRQFNQTLIVTRGAESSIRYRSAMRIRGNSSRSYTYKPLRISVPNDDDLGGASQFNLNPKAPHLQYLGMRLFRAAGLRAPDTIPVELRRNGAEQSTSGGSTPDFGMWVRMEDINADFVSNHWPLSDTGNVYKKGRPDRYWRSNQAAPGNPDSLIDGWSKQNNSAANDWSDLTGFFTTWQANALPHFPGATAGDVAASGGSSTTGVGAWNDSVYTAAEIANLQTVSDFSQWARWFAVMTILQSNETNISNGQDDDYAAYFEPAVIGGTLRRRMHLIPHDLDTIFGLGDSPLAYNATGLYDSTDDSSVFRPLLPLLGSNTKAGAAEFRALYHEALLSLLGSIFDADTTAKPNPPFNQFVDYHLGNWAPAATRTAIKDFVRQRSTYLQGLLAEAAYPPAVGTSNATVNSTHGLLIISEVLANNVSAHANGGLYPDIIELRNTSGIPVDLGGRSLTDDPLVKNKYTFPPGTIVPAGGFITVYADSAVSAPGIHAGFSLDADGDAVYLYDTVPNGQAVIDSVVFGLQAPNLSIGRTGATLNTWALCTPTISAANSAVATLAPASGLRINEWLGNADFRASDDFVELFNPGAQPAALGGMFLTDDAINFPTRGAMPQLSFMAAGAFVAFEAKGGSATPGKATELPYNIDSSCGSLSLLGANSATVDRVDTVTHFRDASVGRLPDGTDTLQRLSVPSPGLSNAPLPANSVNLLSFLRITEMMYNPASSAHSEYIELRNMSDKSATPVTLTLTGVAFTSGITYEFPAAATLAPGAHWVIAGDQAKFENQFPGVTVAGVFTGKLDNDGERVRFEIPGGGISILDFQFSDNWHPSTDGQGSALQIVDGTASPAMWDRSEGWQAIAPNPGGSPPFGVGAGPDVSSLPNTPCFLDGTVYLGTAAPQQVTVAWTKQSGPGTVTFTTPDYENANAIFSLPGIYVLKLTATGPAAASASDTMQVTVSESYAAWAARTIPGASSSQQEPGSDPDRDGVPNLLEYATGTDPLTRNQPLQMTLEGGALVIRYTRNKLADAGVLIIPEISEDLLLWTNNSQGSVLYETLESEDAQRQTWRVQSLQGVNEFEHRYIRLKVIAP